ncbi:MAG: carbohydrate kinase family protein [Micrococcales bacterium]|nr:carbohydrate kinase family protein [Micrococcales bacterium]
MTPSTPAPVLVVGDANIDLILRGDVVPRFGQVEQLIERADAVLGGSGAIVAAGLARLGVPVSLVAVVGDDAFGVMTLEYLRWVGVDTAHVRVVGEPTALSVILSAPGDRAILTLLGALPSLTAVESIAAVADTRPRWVHAASPFLTGSAGWLPELFAAAHDGGAGTSLDTNWDPAEGWAGVAKALAGTDVLLPNRAELLALAGAIVGDPAAGEAAPEDPARALAALGPRVVVKDGAEGGFSLDRHGRAAAARGLLAEVVDTTGAGDSFDAGYLAAIAHGIDTERERLAWAAATGSMSVQAAGGTSGQPSLVELREALRTASPQVHAP